MKRLFAPLIVVVAALVLTAPAAAATVFTATIAPTSLTLPSGETATVSGELAVAITRFDVQDGTITASATVNGTLVGTTSSGTAVTATFTNTRISATITNLQADCRAGTLSFDFRAVVKTSGVDLTVDGTSVPLTRPIRLSGSIAVSTDEITDPAVAGRVGAIICRVDALLNSGASLDQIVTQLNALLRALT